MTNIKDKLNEIDILLNEPLSNYTYTKTGGPADALAFPKSVAEVKELLAYAKEHNMPWQVLGNASNLIVRDGGIRGLVIILTKMNDIQVANNEVTAQAGASLIETTKVARDHSLTGMEFACGIPGSVGGAVYMNAGAYGGEVKDCFKEAEVLLPTGEVKTYDLQMMDFTYRHSAIQETAGIILSATFALDFGEQESITLKMNELNDLRRSKQPLEYPSCGSVFKRPEGHYTGPLIIEAGLQGKIIGGAQVSTKHAGFIVNINHATATDYIQLINHIIAVVQEKFNITLEPEVRIIGEEK